MAIAALTADSPAEHPATILTITLPKLPEPIPLNCNGTLSVSAIELVSGSPFPLMHDAAKRLGRGPGARGGHCYAGWCR